MLDLKAKAKVDQNPHPTDSLGCAQTLAKKTQYIQKAICAFEARLDLLTIKIKAQSVNSSFANILNN